MNSVVMELTGREKEILDEAAAKVEEEMAFPDINYLV